MDTIASHIDITSGVAGGKPRIAGQTTESCATPRACPGKESGLGDERRRAIALCEKHPRRKWYECQTVSSSGPG